ncbi:MAG: hypothetical protein R6U64_01215 [Bacteroidales bacterium]
MKRFIILVGLSMAFLIMGTGTLEAQGRLLRRLKQEAEKKAVEEIFGEEEKEKKKAEEEAAANKSNTRNRKGGGLSQNVPDVDLSIDEAAAMFASHDYKSSKISLREAIWGIELEMGQNVLKSLPEKVQGLAAMSDNDQVTSSGMGFAGMLIERTYAGDDDMEFVVSVGNDAAILGIAHMMTAGDMFRQSTENPDQKQIRYQEHRAVIEYDEYSGYSLTAPFGQTSLLVLKGVNFETEESFMAAANQIDLNVIKQKLGEQ